MGMYDSIMIGCPKCGQEIEFQTKAGGCYLNSYTIKDAPPECLAELDEEIFHCTKCDTWFTFNVTVHPEKVVIAKRKVEKILKEIKKKDHWAMIWTDSGCDENEEEEA